MIFQNGDSKTSVKNNKSENKQKPLPLKQRTSSRTDRRDFTSNTWISLLELIKIREYFITVNNFSIWRRHNAWAFENGKDLRSYITQRYASNMVFMSLLLSTSCGILFNGANITSQVRDDLAKSHYWTLSFWAGLFIIASVLLTILSLISTFTGWAMISAIDESNVHCIVRSSIGQYTTELPGRLITWSIYSFLISFISFFLILIPLGPFSISVLLAFFGIFFHVVSVFSSFGRIIMHAGAMGKGRIFSSEYEDLLVPQSLHLHLLSKAKCNLANNTSIIRQYRHGQQPISFSLLEEELYDHLRGVTKRNLEINNSNSNHVRPRADSKVRFADEEIGLIPSKVVIGGNVDGVDWSNHLRYGSSSSRHFRSLTPLSDTSASQQLSEKSISDQLTPRSIDGGNSMTVSSRNSFLPPIRDDSAGSSLRTSSNSSLEQWLQGSPSQVGRKDKNNAISIVGENMGEKNVGIDHLGGPMNRNVPPKPLSVTTSNTYHNGTYDTIAPSNQYINGNDEVEDRMIYKKPTISRNVGTPISNFGGRGMSEDERFAFDYGESFEDDNPINESKRDDERTSLLK